MSLQYGSSIPSRPSTGEKQPLFLPSLSFGRARLPQITLMPRDPPSRAPPCCCCRHQATAHPPSFEEGKNHHAGADHADDRGSGCSLLRPS
jgi:hypothetical protein